MNTNWWCGKCGSRGGAQSCNGCGVARPAGNPAGMLALLNQGTAMVHHNVTNLTVEGDIGFHYTQAIEEDRALARAGQYLLPLNETSYAPDSPAVYPSEEEMYVKPRYSFVDVTILAATWVGIAAVAFGVLFFSCAVIGACISIHR